MKKLVLISLLLNSLITYSQISLDSNLVLYYPFINGSQNEISYLHHGIGTDVVSATGHRGEVNSALSFNGSTSYIDIPDSRNISGFATMTVSAWIKTSTAQNQIIIGKHSGSVNGEWYLGTLNSGNIRFTHVNASDVRVDCDKPFVYNDGRWHHLAGVYDGSEMKIFVDGNLLGSCSQSGVGKRQANANLRIGRYSAAGWMYQGDIDNVYIYNRALSNNEILALYNQSVVLSIGEIPETSYCVGDSIVISYVISGSLQADNSLNVQLSDAAGNFKRPATIASKQITTPGDGTVSFMLPDVKNGSNYRFRLMTTNAPSVSMDNGVNVGISNPLGDTLNTNSGVLLHYPFNNSVEDISGYDVHGNLVGDFSTSKDFHNNNPGAYSFNGVDNFIYSNFSDSIKVHKGDISVSFWINLETNDSPAYRPVFSTGELGKGVYALINPYSRSLRWGVGNTYIDSPDLPENSWVHVLLMQKDSIINIVVNNEEVASGINTSILDHDGIVLIGKEYSDFTSYFKGSIDEFIIYDKALNPIDVFYLSNYGSLASNSSPVCEGSVLELYAPELTGYTISWTGPDGFNSTERTPVITDYRHSKSGFYSLLVTKDDCTYPPLLTLAKDLQEPPEVIHSAICSVNDSISDLVATGVTNENGTYKWYYDFERTDFISSSDTLSMVTHQSDTFYVSIDNGLGCESAIVPAYAKVFDRSEKPLVSFFYATNTLTSSYAEGNQWYKNGVRLIGEDTQSIHPQDTGNYIVIYTNAGGCLSVSDPYYVTGMSDYQISDNFKLFPNPVSESLIIEGISVEAEMRIQSSNGIILFQSTIHPGEKIDLKDIQPGVYIIEINQGNSIIRKTLIKVQN